MFSPLLLALFVLSAFLLVENVSPLANLWEVTHPDRAKPSYFYGTMHLPWMMIFDEVPSELQNVIRSADVAVFEMDVTNIREQMELHFCQKRKSGPPAYGLSPKLRKRLEKFFGNDDEDEQSWRQLPADALLNKVQGTLLKRWIRAADPRHSDSIFLDLHLMELAKNCGKELRFAERAVDLCELYLGINLDRREASILLNHILDLDEQCPEQGIQQIRTMIDQYKRGQIGKANPVDDKVPCDIDITPVQHLELEGHSKLSSDKIILEGRNLKWVPKMDEWMREEPHKSFAFFFGAAHFSDEQKNATLVQLLSDRGYRIREINAVNYNNYSSRAFPSLCLIVLFYFAFLWSHMEFL